MLTELLRNSRDAGAENIYVASVLRRRRYRTLTVIDDGAGIPERYKGLIFEPGVTSRHLNPTLEPEGPASRPHGAGLSLYHIKAIALNARVANSAAPTAISVTLDTSALPERSLQSDTRPSRSNLRATARGFAQNSPYLHIFYSSPATILATLLYNRIIHLRDRDEGEDGVRHLDLLRERALCVGLDLSVGTLRRVLSGKIEPIPQLGIADPASNRRQAAKPGSNKGGPSFQLDFKHISEIGETLSRAAGSHYLEVRDLRSESRPGEIILRARVYELEDEYD